MLKWINPLFKNKLPLPKNFSLYRQIFGIPYFLQKLEKFTSPFKVSSGILPFHSWQRVPKPLL